LFVGTWSFLLSVLCNDRITFVVGTGSFCYRFFVGTGSLLLSILCQERIIYFAVEEMGIAPSAIEIVEVDCSGRAVFSRIYSILFDVFVFADATRSDAIARSLPPLRHAIIADRGSVYAASRPWPGQGDFQHEVRNSQFSTQVERPLLNGHSNCRMEFGDNQKGKGDKLTVEN
jgi:hypothetical protein